MAARWLIVVVIVSRHFVRAFGHLGLWFSFLCIALAAGYILYDTSNILHHYRTDEHVAASLNCSADVVLMFYHILRVLMSQRRLNRNRHGRTPFSVIAAGDYAKQGSSVGSFFQRRTLCPEVAFFGRI